jgi:hypothetical protein
MNSSYEIRRFSPDGTVVVRGAIANGFESLTVEQLGSLGKTVRYSAASTLFGSPSSA